MRTRWIYLATAALVVGGAAVTAGAQWGRRGGDRPGAALAQLELSDTQKEQLKAMRTEHREAMQALRDSGERPDRETVEALRAEQREDLAEILTEEQLAQLEELRDSRFGHGRRGPWMEMGRGHRGRGAAGPMAGKGLFDGPRRGGPRGAAVLTQLDLSDEQKEKIDELRAEHREEMQELTRKHREALEKVLTKDQRKQLEEMKDDALYGGGPGDGPRDGRRGGRR